jgi:hypothetical protein
VRQCDIIAVDSNDRHVGESLENSFAVSAEAESAVDHHRTRFRQGGSENFEAFVEEHRDMCWGVHVIPVSSDVPIPVRYLPWGKYFRGGRESQHR